LSAALFYFFQFFRFQFFRFFARRSEGLFLRGVNKRRG